MSGQDGSIPVRLTNLSNTSPVAQARAWIGPALTSCFYNSVLTFLGGSGWRYAANLAGSVEIYRSAHY